MAKQQNTWQYYAKTMKSETFNRLNKSQYKKALKVMNKELEKRKTEIENKGLQKYSLFHKGQGEHNNYYKPTNVDIENMTLGQLKQTAYRARQYLNRENSSVTGITKSREKMLSGFKKAGVLRPEHTFVEMDNLLKIYNKLAQNIPDFYTRFGGYKYDIFGLYSLDVMDTNLDYDTIVVQLMNILNETESNKMRIQEEEDAKKKLLISEIKDEYDE